MHYERWDSDVSHCLQVICRQLGLPTANPSVVLTAWRYYEDSGPWVTDSSASSATILTWLNSYDSPIVMSKLACMGSEGSLDECDKETTSLSNCNRALAVGVKCFEADYTVRLANNASSNYSANSEGRVEAWSASVAALAAEAKAEAAAVAPDVAAADEGRQQPVRIGGAGGEAAAMAAGRAGHLHEGHGGAVREPWARRLVREIPEYAAAHPTAGLMLVLLSRLEGVVLSTSVVGPDGTHYCVHAFSGGGEFFFSGPISDRVCHGRFIIHAGRTGDDGDNAVFPRHFRGDTLHSGEELGAYDMLTSLNGRYAAIMQADGNFVIYEHSRHDRWCPGAHWATSTWGQGQYPHRLEIKDDGGLALYDANRRQLWTQGRGRGTGPYRLCMRVRRHMHSLAGRGRRGSGRV
ncbi:hypothetical protein HYH03_012959 [Edaphochlamys debaryana]|uniref:Bulb-type lectin domain-containing protein n=1 Tax=Edaphochlamys debaryana TaxID=47281 RepID=A0A835XRT6_9CHLO|nr:hypothetical protein HYH03_012959 [Edaphochlamys debaryana]|eukprot:KAG2488452.1 hypothetical protein HYH03_012959 [Edaphochlamys debaryana]